MNTEEKLEAVVKMIQAIQVKMDLSDLLLACLIATLPEADELLRMWQPRVAEATTAEALAQFARGVPNEIALKAASQHVALWTTILRQFKEGDDQARNFHP